MHIFWLWVLAAVVGTYVTARIQAHMARTNELLRQIEQHLAALRSPP